MNGGSEFVSVAEGRRRKVVCLEGSFVFSELIRSCLQCSPPLSFPRLILDRKTAFTFLVDCWYA